MLSFEIIILAYCTKTFIAVFIKLSSDIPLFKDTAIGSQKVFWFTFFSCSYKKKLALQHC